MKDLSRALVSFLASIDDEFRNDHLKLCFLWFDEVLIEDITQREDAVFYEKLGIDMDDRKTLHDVSDVILPLGKRIGMDVFADPFDPSRGRYPRWTENDEVHYTYPEPENPQQFAHNVLIDHFAHERGVDRFHGIEVEYAEGLARMATEAVSLWERVNAELPCVLQADENEKIAMVVAKQFDSAPSALTMPFNLFVSEVPSLMNVSWSQLARWRKDGRIDSLREKMALAIESTGGEPESALKALRESIADTSDAMIEKARPKTKRVALESIISNVPGLPIPINPFGIYVGARDALASFKTNRDVGWFYLLRDIKRTSLDLQRNESERY